jgi:Protein of unknown function (DUF4231)
MIGPEKSSAPYQNQKSGGDAMSVEKPEASYEYVRDRYDRAIDYYWKASRNNKRAYKITRVLILVFGALVTLASSLASAKFVDGSPAWDRAFAIGTPLLAAALAFLGGYSQTFQWGAAWQDMVLTAERLEKERDRFMVTKPEDLKPAEEMNLLNDFVLSESQGFFERILGRAKTPVTATEK